MTNGPGVLKMTDVKSVRELDLLTSDFATAKPLQVLLFKLASLTLSKIASARDCQKPAERKVGGRLLPPDGDVFRFGRAPAAYSRLWRYACDRLLR